MTIRRALVIGLAQTGVAVTRALRADGCEVAVVEDAPGTSPVYRARVGEVRGLGAELLEAPTAAAVEQLVRRVDVVVPSPLVRPEHPAIAAARAASVPVRSEIDLAAERAGAPIVAVTGTNGKTTVTTMTAAMLQASGLAAVAAGNIGTPLIDAVSRPADVIVAEVSSFQLEFADHFRPRVAIVLAITPDHIDWHGTFERYVAAKARIAAHQTTRDLVVYDADDPVATTVADGVAARRAAVTIRRDDRTAYRRAGDDLVFPDGRVLAPLASLRRALPHDCTNALAAAAAALDVRATLDGVRSALAHYETMPHRVALVGEAKGVRWYDDSKATNPDATCRAVEAFDSVVLLAGGRNKGLDLGVLGGLAPRLRGVVALGEAAPEVEAAFATTTAPVTRAADMRDAVHIADALARPGDVVLLSPACASFDAYSGYAERGDDFAAAVHVLVGASGERA